MKIKYIRHVQLFDRKLYFGISVKYMSNLFFRISLAEKNYSKLFGESLFETIQNYGKYSPMLNWRTIEGTIGINRQKLLKCSNYSPMLNYMCRRGRAYLKQEFLLNSIKNIQKKPVET